MSTCIFENCNKRSNYNYENQKKPIYCSEHMKKAYEFKELIIEEALCNFSNFEEY
jgi:hypothetical protein